MMEGLVILALAISGLKIWALLRQFSRLQNSPRLKRIKKMMVLEGAATGGLLALFFGAPSVGLLTHSLPLSFVWLAVVLIGLIIWAKTILIPRIKARGLSETEAVFDVRVFEDVKAGHANARAYGGLLRPFIVYTKQLKELLSEDEFRAVLAHEVGHIVHHHHVKLVGLLCLFYGVGLISIDQIEPLNLVTFVLMLYITQNLSLPLVSSMMRRFEFQADETARDLVGAEMFIAALKKIWGKDHSPLKDDRLFAFWYGSHPSPEDRLSRLGSCDLKAHAISRV
ncbi:M48 family metalloprotease [Terasakiella sp. A23]|uniref:M48 family metalloprotease n=1 Tax=Terasakiella sp. FCG-A23 TaxID=3080561 RepID=UPI002954250E|nr:M48 family metalloprotease [Terasakiella sp. A23]MDV7339326.1 M48 family metalloprotease [Terasakiella sp. A23]